MLDVFIHKTVIVCKDKYNSLHLHALPSPFFIFMWVKGRVGVSAVSNWKPSKRLLQVRRDALCSVAVPDCSKVRANKHDRCLD